MLFLERKGVIMNKTAIIYASTHHGSTRKLVEAISNKYEVTLIDVGEFAVGSYLIQSGDNIVKFVKE